MNQPLLFVNVLAAHTTPRLNNDFNGRKIIVLPKKEGLIPANSEISLISDVYLILIGSIVAIQIFSAVLQTALES